MRLLKALFALTFIALGVIFGALNRQPVSIDLGFATLPATLGFALLCVLLAGAVLGGVVVLAGVIWPRRRRMQAQPAAGSDPSGNE